MVYMAKTILTLLIMLAMQTSAVNMVESTPAEAAEDFLAALKKQDPQIMEMYMDNSYVNFIYNTDGDEKAIEEMHKALFSGLEYEVKKVKQKNDSAVAKVVISNHDYSQVMDKYDEEAYDYIMDNLYEDDIADKKALEAKCLELYIKEIKEATESEKTVEEVVFIPMVENEYYSWNVIMTDEIMQSVLGDLEILAN